MNNTENKVVLKKMIKKQFFMTVITSFFLLFIVIGSSYSVLSSKTETGLTDVVVQSGNLLASISSTSETIEMNYETLGVSDEVGLSYEPYTFTVKNNGENSIKYYELRIVDKEYGNSTLPHKAINYSLSKNGEDYTEPQNLGDNRSYIYVGGSLAPGESDTFDLKLWVNEEFGKYANNKEINTSIEITLYSDIPTRNYINYDTQGGSYIPKTSITSRRVTNQVPLKSGYSFVGWSTTSDGDVEYESDAIYDGNSGITLYAKYEEVTIMYNLNGGTGDIPSNKASEGITTLVPTKAGYTFKGWSLTENGEVKYQSGNAYSGDETITLYAVWVILDAEGPVCVMTIEGDLAMSSSERPSNINIECTDNDEFEDSDIENSNLTVSNSGVNLNIVNIEKQEIDTGYKYTVSLYATGKRLNQFYIYFAEGAVSDKSGNKNEVSSISVSTMATDPT